METTIDFPRGIGIGIDRHGPSPQGNNENSITTTISKQKKKKDVTKKRRHMTDETKASGMTSSSTNQNSNHHNNSNSNILFGKMTPKTEHSKDSTKLSQSNQKKSKSSHPDDTLPTTTTSSKSLLPMGGGGCTLLKSGGQKQGSSMNHMKIDLLNSDMMTVGLQVLGICKLITPDVVLFALPNVWTGYMLRNPTIPRTTNKSNTTTNTNTTTTLPPFHTMLVLHQIIPVTIVHVTQEHRVGGSVRRRIEVSCLPQYTNPWTLLSRHVVTSYPTTSTSSTSTTTTTTGIKIRAMIHSLEDHGMVLDIGQNPNEIRGFLFYTDIHVPYHILPTTTNSSDPVTCTPNDTTQQNRILPLNVHRLIECVLKPNTTTTTTGIIPVWIPSNIHEVSYPFVNPSSTNNTTTTTSLSDLIPGTCLQNVIVEQTMTNGLAVSFGPQQIYRGAIDTSHIPGTYSISYGQPTTSSSHHTNHNSNSTKLTWQDYYLIHQRIIPRARIIALDTVTKVLRLSILPHLLSYHVSPMDTTTTIHHPTLSIGTIVPDCTVVRVDPNIGAVLALPSEYNRKEMNSEEEDDDMDDLGNSATKKSKKKKDRKTKPLSKAEMTHLEAGKVRVVYVPISKAMDDNETTVGGTTVKSKIDTSLFMKQFAIHTLHTVRIMQLNEYIVDDIVLTGGTASSIIHAHVLSHNDLVPGQVYKQVPVLSHIRNNTNSTNQDISIMIDFGLGVHGLIPSMHLFDSNNIGSEHRRKVIESKYTIGTKLDVRVLTVDPIQKKCWCSCKKPLVKASIDQMITSYDAIYSRMGQVVTGYISKIDDTKGLCVTFCNNVFGRVPIRSLKTELGIDIISENYACGDVVSCRIVHVKQRRTTTDGSRRRSSWLNRNDDDDYDENDDADDKMDVDNGKNSDSKKHMYYEITLSLLVENPDATTASEKDGSALTETSTSPSDSIYHNKVPLSVGIVLPLNSLRVVEMIPGKDKGRNNGFVPGYAIVSIRSKYLLNESDVAASTLPPFVECKLPYDQLLDAYTSDQIHSVEHMDEIANQMLFIGKKINRKGLLLTDPKKSCYEYTNGIGAFAVVTIRPTFITTAELKKRKKQEMSDSSSTNDTAGNKDSEEIIIPGPQSHFHVGALVIGYVATIDERHGAFIRFLDGLTGLVPKTHHGLQLQLYSTLTVTVIAVDDKFNPPKILLGIAKETKVDDAELSETKLRNNNNIVARPPLKAGDVVGDAVIDKLDFHRASLHIRDDKMIGFEVTVKVQIHCTMTKPHSATKKLRKKKQNIASTEQVITSHHPFFKWKVGDTLSNLHILSVEQRGKFWIVEVTDREDDVIANMMKTLKNLNTGDKVTGIISGISKQKGLWMELSPNITAHVPALELSADIDVLNNMETHFPIGSRLECAVLEKSVWETNRHKYYKIKSKAESKSKIPFLSLLGCDGMKSNLMEKPEIGALVVGRVDRTLASLAPPDLMLDFRHGFIGRCCITELVEADDWTNFPLGRSRNVSKKTKAMSNNGDIDKGEQAGGDIEMDAAETPAIEKDQFPHGTFVQCRVLARVSSKPVVEVSLRPSRLEGDMEDDGIPDVGDKVQAFVVDTSKKGCFLRLGRHVEGRTILKELCDGFLPDPAASFPMGRLVVGQVKSIRDGKCVNGVTKVLADIDMRGSIIIDEAQRKTKFEELVIGSKYRASVMRIEEYGVFVKLENCDVSGLVHKSECSDKFIKNLEDLYNPGDVVKVVLLKKDAEKKQAGFGMKASYFEGDEDSDDEEASEEESAEDDDAMLLGDEIESDDENYVAKLSAKMNTMHDKESEDNDDNDDSDNNSDHDDSEKDEEEDDGKSQDDSSDEMEDVDEDNTPQLNTNVGFDWSGGYNKRVSAPEESDDESDVSSDDDEEKDKNGKSKSYKSRQKQAQRQKEEQEISRREIALADGTADENPESAADFERMLAGEPNSSELWIRYMAFYLTMANIPAARSVANRAFDRIEFRQEKEKLNVWCALLTLELKYGTDETLQTELERACQHNNPKHVYLRVCEMMVKHQVSISSSGLVGRTDATFVKMCSKFRSKKTVWIAHFSYLLEQGRYDEAQKVVQKALLSLQSYKHVETLTKYAILAYTHGQVNTARTVFDGLLTKHPKRLDLFFVYTDQEIKSGNITVARSLFQRVASRGNENIMSGKTAATNDEILSTLKYNDKQMKKLFKKWYAFEEAHGTDANQEHVKDVARAYVESSIL